MIDYQKVKYVVAPMATDTGDDIVLYETLEEATKRFHTLIDAGQEPLLLKVEPLMWLSVPGKESAQ